MTVFKLKLSLVSTRSRQMGKTYQQTYETWGRCKKNIASFPVEDTYYSKVNNPNKNIYYGVCRWNAQALAPKSVQTWSSSRQLVLKKIFALDHEFNLSFEQPKSYMCSTCDSGKCTEEHVD